MVEIEIKDEGQHVGQEQVKDGRGWASPSRSMEQAKQKSH